MSHSSQSFAAICLHRTFIRRVIALSARLWHVIGWIWSTLIVGGFLVGLLLSYLMTGTSGLPKPDPRTWFIVHPLLAHPLITSIVLAVALLLTLGCYLTARHEKRERQEQERAREESLMDIGRGIRELLVERKTPPTSTFNAASAARTPATHADPSPPATPLWTVPYRRNRFFTGRENLLKLLHDRLTTTGAAALTQALAVSGMGGIGKTQTAVEFAYRHQQDYQYVLWIRAAARDTLIADFVTIARLLHLPEKEERDQARVVTAVKDWLAQHAGWLLILDNVDDMELAHEYLPLQSKGHILLTTRAQATGVVAEPIAVEKMDQDEGMLLLLLRARVLAKDAPLELASAADRTTAGVIAKAMDGLPLALDQAGAYIERTGCGLARYLELYQQHRTELLRWRSALSPEYPHTVATTWSLSFRQVEQINPAAADLLRFCAFLDPDAIPEEIIIKGAVQLGSVLALVASDAFKLNAAIDVLRTFSLLRRAPDAQSLVIHRLVQVVLKDGMDSQVQRQWAERTVRAVNQALPEVKQVRWSDYERFLPHAQMCAALIRDWKLKSAEAACLLDQTGNYLRERALYASAEPYLVNARIIRQQTLKASHPDQAISLNSLGLLSYHQGRYEAAERYLKEALAIRQKAFGKMHLDVATSLDDLGWLYHNLNRYAEAEELCEQALAIRRNLLRSHHLDVAQSLHHLFVICRAQAKYSKAEVCFQQALRIREDILGPTDARVVTLLNDYAWLCRSLGKYAQAQQLYRRVLTTRLKMLGKGHLHTATCIEDWTTLQVELGQYKKAEQRYSRVLEIRQRELGQEHHQIALTLNNLASLCFLQSQYVRAEALCKQALAIREKAFGSNHRHVAISLDGLAEAYRAQGNFAEAQPLYERALAISTRALGARHPHTATIVHHMASFYFDLGNYTQAEPLYKQALKDREEAFGAKHPAVALSLHSLAWMYHAQGLYVQAEPLYQQALIIRTDLFGPAHPLVETLLNDLARLHCEQDKTIQSEHLY